MLFYNNSKIDGVQEYNEEYPVEIAQTEGIFNNKRYGCPLDIDAELKKQQVGHDRWVIVAANEGGHNCTCVDIVQLLEWLKVHRPDLLTEAGINVG